MKEYAKELFELPLELTELVEQQTSIVQNAISTGIFIGNNSKDAIVTNIDKSVDLVKNVRTGSFELAKSLTNTTKEFVSTVTDQINQYPEKISSFTSSNSSEQSIPDLEHEREQLELAIEKLKGKDKVGVLGEVLSGVSGGAAGAAAAGTIASAAGASTLLGSTSLATALGGVFVTATPVGWVIGAAAIAGAVGYGISKLVRSGSKQDQIREQLIKRFEVRITKLRKKGNNDVHLVEFKQLLSIAIEKNLLTESRTESMVSLIENGSLKIEMGIQRIKSLISSHKVNL
jgi:hypothetical protein